MMLIWTSIFYLTVERELLRGVDLQLAPESNQAAVALADNPRLAQAAGGTTTMAGDVQTSWSRRIGDDLDRLAPAGSILQLADTNGKIIAISSRSGITAIPVPDGILASARRGASSSFTVDVDGTRLRAMVTPVPGEREPRGFVLAASPLNQQYVILEQLRNLLLVGNIVGLLVASSAGWFIAGRGIRPIREITNSVKAIAVSNCFSQRLRVDSSRDELGRLATTLNEMLSNLDAAYSAQRRFVADASHELRSPLTSIRSNIEILQRALDAPKEDRAEALADVAAEVDRMTKLTDDLLSLARADAGHKMEMSKVALHKLIEDVVRQFRLRSNGVVLEIGRLDRTYVQGNVTWLKQLLVILIDNAVKYTPKGGYVTLHLERRRDSADIKVSDTGIGIPPEDLPHIFKRFYRADKARFRNEGGAGLGLSVAQWIAHEHGGQIDVCSEVGKGTTFTVRIPKA